MSNNELLKSLLAKNIVKATAENPITEVKTRISTNVTVTGPDGMGGREERVVKDEKVVVERKLFQQKLGYISYESGGNLSLGNYNMGKFSVNMMIPIGIAITDEYKKQIEDSFAFVKEFVDAKAAVEASCLLKMKQ